MNARTNPLFNPRAVLLGQLIDVARAHRYPAANEFVDLVNLRRRASYYDLARGELIPSEQDLVRMLNQLEVAEATRARALDLRERASGLVSFRQLPSTVQVSFIVADLDATASRIMSWSPSEIPAIVRTEELSRAILGRVLSGAKLDLAVSTEAGRRDARAYDPPQITAIIGERALWSNLGGAATMLDQLRHLLDLATTRDSITIRINLMRGDTWHAGYRGPYTQWDSGDDPTVIHAELAGPGQFYVDLDSGNVDDKIDYKSATQYVLATKALDAEALDIPESIAYIRSVIAQRPTS